MRLMMAMKYALKHVLAASILVLSLAAPVAAGPFDDARDSIINSDYATALRLFRPLANEGHAHAQDYLGLMYFLGRGVPQDYAEALKWYRLAADQGHGDARTFLGLMYESGLGVPQDYVLAHMWFNLAAAQGNQLAVASRDRMASRMTPAQIAEAQKLAREWRPRP